MEAVFTDGVGARLRTKLRGVVDKRALGPKQQTVSMTAMMLAVDPTRSLRSSYDVRGEIGRGSFGVVYATTCRLTTADRAMKRLPKDQVNMEDVHAEMEALLSLDHPNLVRFYEFFEDKENLYLIMELCTGGDLAELSREDDDHEEIRQLFRDVCLAVSYCHTSGVVHRDLKFDNCLLHCGLSRRAAKVIDFGLAAIRARNEDDGNLRSAMGTCYFEAPEVLDPSASYGSKCDCWSLGVMLYIMLTDEHPCAEDAEDMDSQDLYRAILLNAIREEPLDATSVGEEARDFMARLLIKDPDERMSAAEAVAHPFLQLQGPQPWLASSSSRWDGTASQPLPLPDVAPQRSRTPSGISAANLEHLKLFADLPVFEKAVLNIIAHNAQDAEVEDLRNSFMELDTGGTGTLNEGEILAGLHSCGLMVAEEDVSEIFARLDLDGSGKIHCTEWIAAMLRPSLLASDRVIRQAFAFLDTNGSGHINHEDIMRLFECEAVASCALSRIDGNGDGQISEKEFRDMMNTLADKLRGE